MPASYNSFADGRDGLFVAYPGINGQRSGLRELV
jgi:hypothetical protein